MNRTIERDLEGSILLFHRTTLPRAKAILKEGFRDGSVKYGRSIKFEGVWVANVPLAPDQGVKGSVILQINIDLSEQELSDYEWKEVRLDHREWLIPAQVLNTRGRLAVAGGENEANAVLSGYQDHS